MLRKRKFDSTAATGRPCYSLEEIDRSSCEVQGNMKHRVSPGEANEEEVSSFSSGFRLPMSPSVGDVTLCWWLKREEAKKMEM